MLKNTEMGHFEGAAVGHPVSKIASLTILHKESSSWGVKQEKIVSLTLLCRLSLILPPFTTLIYSYQV